MKNPGAPNIAVDKSMQILKTFVVMLNSKEGIANVKIALTATYRKPSGVNNPTSIAT
jgi:hypothetical protein